jgi:hypothetical protein
MCRLKDGHDAGSEGGAALDSRLTISCYRVFKCQSECNEVLFFFPDGARRYVLVFDLGHHEATRYRKGAKIMRFSPHC